MKGQCLSKLAAVILAVSVITGTLLPVDAAVQPLQEAAKEAAASKPEVVEARLINSRDIELYWNQEVMGAGLGDDANFSITVDGVKNPIYFYSYTWPDNYTYTEEGIVYYNQKTSIRLEHPISNIENLSETQKLQPSADLPEIKVSLKENAVKNADGIYADKADILVDAYDPFYQKLRTLDCGVKVLGSETVSEDAMDKAKEMLEVVLENQALAERMGRFGCMLGVYGKGNIAYDIPEHRYTYDENYLYVEGFGGTQLASIKDANVLRQTTGEYRTSYPDESILVHEFGHTVKNYGLTEEQQAEWTKIYRESTEAGKWADTYAGSNEDEYFATLSAIWFNVMDDTWDGKVDGVRGPINTRTELKVYDRAAYDFLASIYPEDKYLPEPWENGTVPNHAVYACSVTFIYEDKETEKSETAAILKGERLTASDIPVPEREGYLFLGWINGSESFDISQPITTDLTLHAEWEKKEETKEPENPNPDKPGQEGPEQGNPNEPENQSPGNSNPENSQPEKKTYQVTFIYISGSKTKQKTVTIKEGEQIASADIPVPVRKGYICSGWTSGGKNFTLSSSITSNLELKAKWSKVTVKKPVISSLKANGKKMIAVIKKDSKVNGYKVLWSKDKKFKKSVKSKYIASNKFTEKKMKKGVYYMKVQAYKLDSAGKRVLSKASKIRKVTIR